MSLSLILIIILAIALVLGPIAMLIPKPEERRREALRLKARTAGLRFTLRKLPVLKTDTESPRTMPCYFLPPLAQPSTMQEWVLVRMPYTHEGHFYRDWDWLGEHRPTLETQAFLQQQVPSLPEGVRALGYGAAGVTLFWNEKEGEALLGQLVSLLKGIQEAEASDQG